jgi:hypothetical protein
MEAVTKALALRICEVLNLRSVVRTKFSV